MLTRSNIAYDLSISPHILDVHYEDETLYYVFSSELYMNIFKRKFNENRQKINESLTKRFGFEITNDKLCDLKLYSATEKRGFLIRGKVEYECLESIRLNGETLI